MIKRILAGMVLAILAVVGAALWLLPAFVERMAVSEAEAFGFRNVRIDIEHIGFTGASVRSVAIGDGFEAKDVRIAYRAPSVLRGEIGPVTVADLRVSGSLKEGETLLPFLDGVTFAADEDIVLPTPQIDVKRAAFDFATPSGPLTISIAGRMERVEPSGLTLSGSFSGESAEAKASGAFDGQVAGSGEILIVTRLSEGSLKRDDVSIAGASGDVRIQGSFEGLESLSASLAIPDLVVSGVMLGDAQGKAEHRKNSLALDVSTRSKDGFASRWSVRLTGGESGGGIETSGQGSMEAAGYSGHSAVSGLEHAVTGTLGIAWSGHIADPVSAIAALDAGALPQDVSMAGTIRIGEDKIEAGAGNERLAAAGGLAFKLSEGVLAFRASPRLDMSSSLRGRATLREAKGGAPLVQFGPALRDMRADIAAAFDIAAANAPALSGDVSLRFAGNLDEFDAPFRAHLAMPSSGEALPISVERGRTSVTGRVAGRDGAWSAAIDACFELDAGAVRVPNLGAIPTPIGVCPSEAGRPILALSATPESGFAAALNASLTLAPFRIENRTESADVTPGRISLEARSGGNLSVWSMGIETSGGALRLPTRSLSVDGLAVTATASLDAQGDWVAAMTDLKARLADTRAIPFFAPLDIEGSGAFDGRAVSAKAVARDAQRIMEIAAQGQFDFETDTGRGEFETKPLRFASDRKQPYHLSPFLRGKLTGARGGVSAQGWFDWRDGALTSGGALDLNGLSMQTFLASIEGVSATIAFDSLYPLSTPPSQVVRVRSINPGLAFNDGEMMFALRDGRRLVFESLSWPWAGGRLHAENLTFDFDEPRNDLLLKVDGVRLESLLLLFDLKNLNMMATIGGELPLVIEDGVPYIRKGWLKDDGTGGSIRYRSEQADAVMASGGASTNLLLRAVEDFRFKQAEITIDGALTGALTVGLHLEGANPKLYSGYPIELNFSLEGQLGELVKAGMTSLNVTRDLKNRIEAGQ